MKIWIVFHETAFGWSGRRPLEPIEREVSSVEEAVSLAKKEFCKLDFGEKRIIADCIIYKDRRFAVCDTLWEWDDKEALEATVKKTGWKVGRQKVRVPLFWYNGNFVKFMELPPEVRQKVE